MSITVATDANLIVSPFIADYAPESSMNISAELHETVTLTGIDRVFQVTLDLSDSLQLLNSFDVSGVVLDYTQGQTDVNVANLNVAVTNAEDFKAVLLKAILDASGGVVAEGEKSQIHTYMETRLRDVIKSKFNGLGALTGATWGSSLSGTATGGEVNSADNIALQTQGGAAPGTIDEEVAAATMSAEASTQVTGLQVAIELSEDAMAEECKAVHIAGSVASLFRQISQTTWENYKNAQNTRLTTIALPMIKGQELAFAFDIDVASTKAINDDMAVDGTTPPSDQPETVPIAVGGSANFSSVQLNLGNRRIVFRLKLTDGSGAFDVGANGLKANPEL